MTWGRECRKRDRAIRGRGRARDDVSRERDTYRFEFAAPPAELVGEFRTYYGTTINASEAAAASGRVAKLQADWKPRSRNKTRAGPRTSPRLSAPRDN
jgi:hypothetical protein